MDINVDLLETGTVLMSLRTEISESQFGKITVRNYPQLKKTPQEDRVWFRKVNRKHIDSYIL
ncbi:hypothetical protein [Candidatus Azobacteroides pseudotrichonymphae]|uniref:hypothetical protein n=1 Tax=Candidatus Azobacteroides pseudotrichonymphae TaxID=511435 RepID=UPI0005A24ED4|nr:hypothetical protein [Candidatus Azobacteroides pseudotrichonymphae]